MDQSFVSSFEINLGWISNTAYMQRLRQQVQSCKAHEWLYDLRSRLYFMLSQCQPDTRIDGILQLRSYLLNEVSVLGFGVSCRNDAVDTVLELLQADPELCRLDCVRAKRDRETGIVGYEPVEAPVFSVYAS